MRKKGVSRKDSRRVVITGMGVVSCLGSSVATFWRALLERRYGIRPLTRFDASRHRIGHGGEVVDFELKDSPDPAVQFLLAAGMEALSQAGLAESCPDPRRACVVVGSNFGAMEWTDRFLMGVSSGAENTSEYPSAVRMADAVERLVGAAGFEGPAISMSLSCASGGAAMAQGAELVREGEASVALVGGFDAISELSWSGLAALRTMTAGLIRPFDRRRDGTVFSEGAGVLVLESLAGARDRNAPILAELLGCWTNNNAFHMTHPDKSGAGMARAMREAIREAGLGPADIDHVNSHGTATRHNDSIETTAIKSVLGEHARRIPVNSIKSMVGHGMGAASAFEAVCSVMTVREGVVPPTINLEEPDPECDLDYVPDGPRECDVRVVLSNASGIGGPNNAVVLARFS